jgi:uncharacterized protein YbcC (UPF0753/DUF2309 family)
METVGVELDPQIVWNDVIRVCNRIPPLWNLRNYVAVNPFLGFAEEPIDQAAKTIGDGLDARVLPDIEFYRKRWQEGAFDFNALDRAASRSGLDAQSLRQILEGRTEAPRREAQPILTFAERHDRLHGTDWNEQLCRSVARWCAVYVSEGGTYWGLSCRQQGLYRSWLESARADRSLEITGLRGWRAWTANLPEQADEAMALLLTRLRIEQEDRVDYLYRLLGGLYGWASYLRRTGWENGGDDPGALADLLAIRICTDAAVYELARAKVDCRTETTHGEMVEDESIRLVFQEALEDGFVRNLLGKLAPPPRSATNERPLVQAVFCIDVRSETLRRHLEKQTTQIETLGFAGFFGVAVDWLADDCGSARCPVLLKPSIKLRPAVAGQSSVFVPGSLKHVQGAPAASFSFVELLGLGYGIRLAADSTPAFSDKASADGRDPFRLDSDIPGEGLNLSTKADLAAGILKNLGLASPFARLVLLCGHEGQSTNNPHAASLDCGACGGHGGALNARISSALLNDPAVRKELSERGWNIPSDTHFLPAVHNTSTDQVSLFDVEQAPPDHASDIGKLQTWLQQASEQVRLERAPALGLGSRPAQLLQKLLRRRSRDWSEVRPEWGLARNAAFLAARRVRSRGVDLEGRVFLHEYDAAKDTDNSVLRLILSAPMVVASWINLQYFASTVDNRVFGCGTKTLHNRVSSIGVVLGNGGDLRTGLAVQSVHAPDGSWYHEPLRLQVVVEAPPERIEQVLTEQPGVKQLIENGWVRLFALDPQSNGVFQRLPSLEWRSVSGVESTP